MRVQNWGRSKDKHGNDNNAETEMKKCCFKCIWIEI